MEIKFYKDTIRLDEVCAEFLHTLGATHVRYWHGTDNGGIHRIYAKTRHEMGFFKIQEDKRRISARILIDGLKNDNLYINGMVVPVTFNDKGDDKYIELDLRAIKQVKRAQPAQPAQPTPPVNENEPMVTCKIKTLQPVEEIVRNITVCDLIYTLTANNLKTLKDLITVGNDVKMVQELYKWETIEVKQMEFANTVKDWISNGIVWELDI